MSEYFRILNRVEEEHAEADLNTGSKPVGNPDEKGAADRNARTRRRPSESRPAVRARTPEQAPSTSAALANPAVEPSYTPTPSAVPTPRRVPLAQAQVRRQSFARAFDNLRAIAVEQELHSVVIAPCSGREAVGDVIDGLAAEAELHELHTVTAHLSFSDGRYVIREREMSDAQAKPEAADPVSFRLNAGALPAELTAWIDASRAQCDLLLVQGPALGENVDAALVGRATDGVILVIEPHITTHEDLRAAVDRARSVHCKLLGIVANGTSDDIPAWMRQITG